MLKTDQICGCGGISVGVDGVTQKDDLSVDVSVVPYTIDSTDLNGTSNNSDSRVLSSNAPTALSEVTIETPGHQNQIPKPPTNL